MPIKFCVTTTVVTGLSPSSSKTASSSEEAGWADVVRGPPWKMLCGTDRYWEVSPEA